MTVRKLKNKSKIFVAFILSLSIVLGVKFALREYRYAHLSCPTNLPSIDKAPDNPFFSIILATYNREDFLKRSICSALAQTYENFELIIIDDGSTDNSERVIKKLTENDARVRYLKNEVNSGLFKTRNRGLREARGDYVLTLDSDDYFFPVILEETKKFLDANPGTAVAYPYVLMFNDDNEPLGVYGSDNILEMLARDIIPDGGTAYNRRYVLERGFSYDETMLAAGDYNLFADIIMSGGKVMPLRSILSAWRVHYTNSAEYYSNQKKNAFKVRQKLNKYFSSNHSFDLCQNFNNLNERAHEVFTTEQIAAMKNKYCK